QYVGTGRWLDMLYHFQTFGLTPPVALGWFAFHGNGVWNGPVGVASMNPELAIESIAAGLLLWGLGAVWLWRGNETEFAAQAGRLPRRPGPAPGPTECPKASTPV